MDHEQAMAEQAVDDLVGHALAAEEDRPLMLLEGAQAGIGAGRQADREDRVEGVVGGGRRAGVHGAPPACKPLPPSQSRTATGQPASVPSIQSACTMRAVARRTLVAMVAPAVSSRPQGSSR